MKGLRPVAEIQFADYIHPAYDQIVNQAATIRWRSVGAFGVPGRVPRAVRRRRARRPVPLAERRGAVLPRARPEDRRPGDAVTTARACSRARSATTTRSVLRAQEELPPPARERAGPTTSSRSAWPDVDATWHDLTIITYGIGVHLARGGQRATARRGGIDVEILDLRTLRAARHRRDRETVAKTSKVLILHEENKTRGIGAEIAAFIAEELFEELDGPIMRVAADDCHLPYNGPEEDAIIPLPPTSIRAARALAGS